jgi:hypothetical protein
MGSLFGDIGNFIVAVVSHWQSYVTGGVITGLIGVVERLSEWRMPKWAYASTFLGVFLLVSFFLAWREQYQEAQKLPALESQLQEKDKTIQQLKEKPPQVQVNIPGQMAYMSSTDIGVVLDSYRIGGNFVVSTTCKNLSTSVVAEDAACVRGLRVVSTKLNAQKQPVVTTEVQDATYRQFQKDIASIDVERRPYGPGESFFASVATPPVDEKLDAALRAGSKTVLYVGEYSWKDGLGPHTNEICAWLQIYPGMFSGPGALARNASITWNHCKGHDGLQSSQQVAAR